MKWLTKTRIGKAILVFGFLLFASALLLAFVHSSSKAPVEEYKRQLRAAGEKLTIAELSPPRVSPELNSARLFLQAATNVEPWDGVLYTNPPKAMQIVGLGKAKVGWQQPDVRNDEGTNTWEEIELALRERSGALQALNIERPVLDFELDYSKSYGLLLPHLSPLKHYCLFLSAAAVCDLHEGKWTGAVTNTRTILAIAHGMHNEPLLISELVRISMVSIAAYTTWELLQSTNVPDECLIALQRDWTNLEFQQSAERALQMERAMILATLANLRTSNSPVDAGGGLFFLGEAASPARSSGNWREDLESFWTGAQRRTVETLWRTSWSYSDELRALRGYQVLIEAIRQIQTNGVFKDAFVEKDRKLTALGYSKREDLEWLWEKLDGNEIRFLGAGGALATDHQLVRIERIEAIRQLAIAAIALKRHQSRYGNFPTTLGALAPEFLPTVPRDPVDGLSLRYRLNSDGTFLLYSISEDGKDDGGDASQISINSRSWERRHDLVWPQPASAKEIEDYEKEVLSRKQ